MEDTVEEFSSRGCFEDEIVLQSERGRRYDNGQNGPSRSTSRLLISTRPHLVLGFEPIQQLDYMRLIEPLEYIHLSLHNLVMTFENLLGDDLDSYINRRFGGVPGEIVISGGVRFSSAQASMNGINEPSTSPYSPPCCLDFAK